MPLIFTSRLRRKPGCFARVSLPIVVFLEGFSARNPQRPFGIGPGRNGGKLHYFTHSRSWLFVALATASLWGFSDNFVDDRSVVIAETAGISPLNPVVPQEFDELDAVTFSQIPVINTVEIAEEPIEETTEVSGLTGQFLEEERARIRRELDLSRDGLKKWVGGEIDRTEQKIKALDTRIDSMAPEVAVVPQPVVSPVHRSKAEMMIYPVVQLRGNGTVGSGVVVSCQRVNETTWETWIVTAYHVVEEVRDFASEEVVIREIRFFDPQLGRLSTEVHHGFEIANLPDTDLSLVRIDRKSPWNYIADAATESACDDLEVFDGVYAVGCPLGNQPLPTYGEISSQYKPVGEEVFWMVSAPTFFGNSGGGIFLAGDGRLVGISSMIYTYGKRSPMVVPHMGLFVPLHTVRSWLRREGYAHLMGVELPGTPVPASSGPETVQNRTSGSF